MILGRRPGRPFDLAADPGNARPLKAFLADADAVAHGLAVVLDMIEPAFGGIDDDGAGLFPGVVGDIFGAE